MSNTVTMFGWFSEEADWASFSKRRSRPASEERDSGRTFTATSRPSRVSRARYTSPIPPAPTGARIRKWPSVVPIIVVLISGLRRLTAGEAGLGLIEPVHDKVDVSHGRRGRRWNELPSVEMLTVGCDVVAAQR